MTRHGAYTIHGASGLHFPVISGTPFSSGPTSQLPGPWKCGKDHSGLGKSETLDTWELHHPFFHPTKSRRWQNKKCTVWEEITQNVDIKRKCVYIYICIYIYIFAWFYVNGFLEATGYSTLATFLQHVGTHLAPVIFQPGVKGWFVKATWPQPTGPWKMDLPGISPRKTNMTLENPHVQKEIHRLIHGGFSIVHFRFRGGNVVNFLQFTGRLGIEFGYFSLQIPNWQSVNIKNRC